MPVPEGIDKFEWKSPNDRYALNMHEERIRIINPRISEVLSLLNLSPLRPSI
jgi:hypothetical protein